MHMADLLTFAKFHSEQEAETLVQILKDSNIEFDVEHERNPLDKIYIGETIDPMISVKIPATDFEKTNDILLAHAKTQLTGINPEYYLFHFTNQELTEVLHNPDDWNHFDQALAQKLLQDRNAEIPSAKTLRPGKDIYKPAHLESHWLLAEYLLTVTLIYAGIIIGMVTLFAFKTLNNGEKVNLYDKPTRIHAKIMLSLGIIRTLYQLLMPVIR